MPSVAAPEIAGDRRTITISEAANILGIGRNSAYEAARKGEIPTIKIGRLVLVPRDALDRLLAGDRKVTC
jgi:excisionase family DNA binding protein